MARRVFVLMITGVCALVAASVPGTRPATQAAKVKADNSYCLTCHINFQKETLAFDHQKAGIGCDACHGESEKHSSDENGITPPDIMFPRGAINLACMKCHDAKQLAKEKRSEHDSFKPGAPAEEKPSFCTECHGRHVMAVRTRRWDKVTGKLIADDGVRVVEEKGGK